jgi:hypothetical protein
MGLLSTAARLCRHAGGNPADGSLAGLTSFLASGEVTGNAPIPSLGLAGRVYPIRQLAINARADFMKVTDLDTEHVGQTFDFEVSGTLQLPPHRRRLRRVAADNTN